MSENNTTQKELEDFEKKTDEELEKLLAEAIAIGSALNPTDTENRRPFAQRKPSSQADLDNLFASLQAEAEQEPSWDEIVADINQLFKDSEDTSEEETLATEDKASLVKNLIAQHEALIKSNASKQQKINSSLKTPIEKSTPNTTTIETAPDKTVVPHPVNENDRTTKTEHGTLPSKSKVSELVKIFKSQQQNKTPDKSTGNFISHGRAKSENPSTLLTEKNNKIQRTLQTNSSAKQAEQQAREKIQNELGDLRKQSLVSRRKINQEETPSERNLRLLAEQKKVDLSVIPTREKNQPGNTNRKDTKEKPPVGRLNPEKTSPFTKSSTTLPKDPHTVKKLSNEQLAPFTPKNTIAPVTKPVHPVTINTKKTSPSLPTRAAIEELQKKENLTHAEKRFWQETLRFLNGKAKITEANNDDIKIITAAIEKLSIVHATLQYKEEDNNTFIERQRHKPIHEIADNEQFQFTTSNLMHFTETKDTLTIKQFQENTNKEEKYIAAIECLNQMAENTDYEKETLEIFCHDFEMMQVLKTHAEKNDIRVRFNPPSQQISHEDNKTPVIQSNVPKPITQPAEPKPATPSIQLEQFNSYATIIAQVTRFEDRDRLTATVTKELASGELTQQSQYAETLRQEVTKNNTSLPQKRFGVSQQEHQARPAATSTINPNNDPAQTLAQVLNTSPLHNNTKTKTPTSDTENISSQTNIPPPPPLPPVKK
jgi:hypothetical protein